MSSPLNEHCLLRKALCLLWVTMFSGHKASACSTSDSQKHSPLSVPFSPQAHPTLSKSTNQPFNLSHTQPKNSHVNLTTSTMTQQFLEALPEISLGELPSESTCMICLNAYGTSSPDNGSVAENPVRLPCNHHVGSDCISTWLSPSKTAQNSCPYCRAKFFPAQPRPYMEHGLMDDDEGAHTAAPGNPMVEMTSRIGRIGRPVRAPEDRDEWDDDDDDEEEEQIWAERDSQSMYAYFF